MWGSSYFGPNEFGLNYWGVGSGTPINVLNFTDPDLAYLIIRA